jgi:hypothetical protein
MQHARIIACPTTGLCRTQADIALPHALINAGMDHAQAHANADVHAHAHPRRCLEDYRLLDWKRRASRWRIKHADTQTHRRHTHTHTHTHTHITVSLLLLGIHRLESCPNPSHVIFFLANPDSPRTVSAFFAWRFIKGGKKDSI